MSPEISAAVTPKMEQAVGLRRWCEPIEMGQSDPPEWNNTLRHAWSGPKLNVIDIRGLGFLPAVILERLTTLQPLFKLLRYRGAPDRSTQTI